MRVIKIWGAELFTSNLGKLSILFILILLLRRLITGAILDDFYVLREFNEDH